MQTCEIRNSRYAARVEVETEQDASGNRTAVQVSRVEVHPLGGEGSCRVTGSVRVNGMQAAVLADSVLGGERVWVPHSADGSGSITIQADLRVQTEAGTVSGVNGAVQLVLPRIPRVTTLWAEGVELGQTMEIRLERKVSRFRDTVQWRCGSASGILAERTGEQRIVWNVPEVLAEQVPDGQLIPVVLSAATFDGDTPVGTGETEILCTLPDSAVPQVQLTLSEPMGHGGYWQNETQLRVQTAVTNARGADTAQIRVEVCGLTGQGEDVTFVLPEAGEQTVTVTVTDTRGRKGTASAIVAVHPNEKPLLEITGICRCNEMGETQADGEYVRVTFRASMSPVPNGTVIYLAGIGDYRIGLNEFTGQTEIPEGITVIPLPPGGGETCFLQSMTLLGDAYSSPVPIPPESVLLDCDREARALGIGMDVNMHGCRVSSLPSPSDDRDAATKEYVDTQLRRLAEAFGAEMRGI